MNLQVHMGLILIYKFYVKNVFELDFFSNKIWILPKYITLSQIPKQKGRKDGANTDLWNVRCCIISLFEMYSKLESWKICRGLRYDLYGLYLDCIYKPKTKHFSTFYTLECIISLTNQLLFIINYYKFIKSEFFI